MEKKEAYTFNLADAEAYDHYLGPVMFDTYGRYLASVLETAGISSVLELAAGTGRVTGHLRRVLPGGVQLLATDVSADMLGIAKRKLGDSDISFETADMQKLPFANNSFDLVVCQFGMMFLPDKQRGFDETFRVLKPGGKFICFTWDDTANNPVFALLVNKLILPHFAGEDTTRFLTPFLLHNPQQLSAWMETAGFKEISVERVGLNADAASVDHIETGFYRKHPLGKAMKEVSLEAFEEVAQQFRQGILKQWGKGPVAFPMSALMTVGVK